MCKLWFVELQRFYIPTSRQLKRIESTTRSPIFNHFSESITGAASIRAYKVQSCFIDENRAKVDKNLVFYFAGISSNRQVNCLCGDDVGNVMIWSHEYSMLELCQYIKWTCYTHSYAPPFWAHLSFDLFDLSEKSQPCWDEHVTRMWQEQTQRHTLFHSFPLTVSAG